MQKCAGELHHNSSCFLAILTGQKLEYTKYAKSFEILTCWEASHHKSYKFYDKSESN